MLGHLKELLAGISWRMLARAANKVPTVNFVVTSTGKPLAASDVRAGVLTEQSVKSSNDEVFGIFGQIVRFQSPAAFRHFTDALLHSLPNNSEVVLAVHNSPVVLGPSLTASSAHSLVHPDGPTWCADSKVYLFLRIPNSLQPEALQHIVTDTLSEGRSSFLLTEGSALVSMAPLKNPEQFTAIRCTQPLSGRSPGSVAPLILSHVETWDVYHLQLPTRRDVLAKAVLRGDGALARAKELFNIGRPVGLSRTVFVNNDTVDATSPRKPVMGKTGDVLVPRHIAEVLAHLRDQGITARCCSGRTAPLAFRLGLPWQLPLKDSIRFQAQASAHVVVDHNTALNNVALPFGQSPVSQLPQPIPTLRAKNEYGEATLFERLPVDQPALTVMQGNAGSGLTYYSNALLTAKVQAGQHGWSIRSGPAPRLDAELQAEKLVIEQYKPVSINPLYGFESADAFHMAVPRLRLWLRSLAKLTTNPASDREEYEVNKAIATALEGAWQLHRGKLSFSHVLEQLHKTPDGEPTALALMLGTVGVGDTWFEGKPDFDVTRPYVSILMDSALPSFARHALVCAVLTLYWNCVEGNELVRPILVVDDAELLGDSAAEVFRGLVRRMRVFRGQVIVTTRRLSRNSRNEDAVAEVLLENVQQHVLLRSHDSVLREWLEPQMSSKRSLYQALDFVEKRGNALVLDSGEPGGPRFIEPIVDRFFLDLIR